MRPETFEIIADSLGMNGKGREAAKDVLTAQVGTLSAAAQRHGISRPAVARQVNRIQSALDQGEVEVTLTVTLGELEELIRQRVSGTLPLAPAPSSFTVQAEKYLTATLGTARPPTKSAAYFGSARQIEIVLERQRNTGLFVWVASEPVTDHEIAILKNYTQPEENQSRLVCHPFLPTSFASGPRLWHLRIASLDALAKLVNAM